MNQSYDLLREQFAPWVASVYQSLVATGQLPATETCNWDLAVIPKMDNTPRNCVVNPSFELLPILTQQGVRPDKDVTCLHSDIEIEPNDVPVFLSQQALQEAIEYCQGDTTVERGGVFLGHLYRDSTGVYVSSSTFAPAWDAEASATTMRFDRTAWENIHRHRVATGDLDLNVVAWLHSHPFRIESPTETEGVPLLTPSSQDVAIQATFFPDPHLTCFIIDPFAEDIASNTAIWGWSHDGAIMQQRTVFIYGGDDE
jgi:hypothetical protein